MTNGDLDRLFEELRPRLHRYCARMTGSVIDGEDVVQEALAKATAALPGQGAIADFKNWLFRIAHNASIDFLRRKAQMAGLWSGEDPEMLSDWEEPVQDPDIVEASLRTFMRLNASQRSAVILMDVLGYRLQEITTIMSASLPAVKSALHRGRMRLREFAREPEDRPPVALADAERLRLQAYVERFNAGEFEIIRDMLAEDVKLELVDAERRSGRAQVAGYFQNYIARRDWSLSAGVVDGRAAVIVSAAGDPSRTPIYFVLLNWQDDSIINIRDFRYARYAVEGAEIAFL